MVAFGSEIASWLRYKTLLINLAIGQTGKFCQQEPFDHLVHSSELYGSLRQSIADNPRQAHVRPGEFLDRRHI